MGVVPVEAASVAGSAEDAAVRTNFVIVGRMPDRLNRVVPGVSIPPDTAPSGPPAIDPSMLAAAGRLFAGLVPDDNARDAAVRALVELVATAVARARSESEPWISQEEASGRLGTDRQTLDGMLKRAPALPGGPVDVGLGKRHQYRWDGSRIGEWASAYQTWKREQESAKTKPHPTRRGAAKPRSVHAGVVNWNDVGRGDAEK